MKFGAVVAAAAISLACVSTTLAQTASTNPALSGLLQYSQQQRQAAFHEARRQIDSTGFGWMARDDRVWDVVDTTLAADSVDDAFRWVRRVIDSSGYGLLVSNESLRRVVETTLRAAQQAK